jgi:hypothetical protein
MALLARAAILGALAGCYSPDLRDCTVTCATSDDCAGTQVCGADHFCAVREKAGTCSRLAPDAATATGDGATPTSDAAVAADAAPADAAPPDAPSLGALELVVMGHGQLVAGSHMCSTDCTFMVPLAPIDVVAVAGGDQSFVGWTVGPCVGSQSTTCTVTPPATVGVKFHKEDN